MQRGLSLPREGSFGFKEPARMRRGSQKLLLMNTSTGGMLVSYALKASCPPEWPQEPHKPFSLVSLSPTGGEGCEERPGLSHVCICCGSEARQPAGR